MMINHQDSMESWDHLRGEKGWKWKMIFLYENWVAMNELDEYVWEDVYVYGCKHVCNQDEYVMRMSVRLTRWWYTNL